MINPILTYVGQKPQPKLQEVVPIDTIVTVSEGDYLIIGHNYNKDFRLQVVARSVTEAKTIATSVLSRFCEIESIIYLGKL